MPFNLTLLAAASATTWMVPAVPERELSQMRGGFQLPNGLNIAIGIDIQTHVDGVLALHTIYSSEAPDNAIQVYTDGTTAPSSPPGTTPVVADTGQAPAIIAARSSTGTTVTVAGDNVTSVNLLVGPTSTWLDAPGQTRVPVAVNGPPVSASSGSIALDEDARGASVILSAPGLEIQHLIGQATGAVIANTSDNRTIDTVSSINVNLIGVPAALLGGTLMIDRLAAEAAGRR